LLHKGAKILDKPAPLDGKGYEWKLPEQAIPWIDKYDYLLPPTLLVKQYAAHMLDLGELRTFAASI
jgi:hypothetical protein